MYRNLTDKRGNLSAVSLIHRDILNNETVKFVFLIEKANEAPELLIIDYYVAEPET